MATAWMVGVPRDERQPWSNPSNPGFPSNISVGVSFSGALVKDRFSYIRADQPAYLDFHGCDDSTCPYNDGGIQSIALSAVSTHREMDKVSAVNGLISLPGQGHVPMPAIDTH